jgi:N-formylglutamate deformylase
VTALPLILSVPHAGLAIPPGVAAVNLLTPEEIAQDGDEGAAAVFLPLAPLVAAFVSTPIARAFVDMNRARDDLRKDGVVKTHTCWDVPIYSRQLAADEVEELLVSHYDPYHAALAERTQGVRLGIDCHTMAASGPPVGPDPGKPRPRICLGNGRGETCPDDVVGALADSLHAHFGCEVALNEPFSGGFITRSRPGGIPWVQLELSREDWLPLPEKNRRLGEALTEFCASGMVQP